jgi:hypothetical protein
LLEQEHLTALGVRMRLQEIFASHGKKDRGRKAQDKTAPKGPSPSASGQDSSIQ